MDHLFLNKKYDVNNVIYFIKIYDVSFTGHLKTIPRIDFQRTNFEFEKSHYLNDFMKELTIINITAAVVIK